MGLTVSSTQRGTLKKEFDFEIYDTETVVALGGNPNVGKSTVFNALTGLKQHTGNWPGKTVANAGGRYTYQGQDVFVVDLPGTYSLMSDSVEEEIARNFLCFGNPDVTVVVLDATCLERNLNLALQILEITPNTVVCVNLMDQAKKRQIKIHTGKLEKILNVPVVAISALQNDGLDRLQKAVYTLSRHPNQKAYTVTYDQVIESAVQAVCGALPGHVRNRRFVALKLLDGEKGILNSIARHWGDDVLDNADVCRTVSAEKEKLAQLGIHPGNFCDRIVASLVQAAEEIAGQVVETGGKAYQGADRKIDKILTSKLFGIPIMLAFLGVILWITIAGANYPSQWLSRLFTWAEGYLSAFLALLHTPMWLHSVLIDGMYRTLAWVVSVMLPPMAIFFPLFTLMEDLGYLPRIAFNLDNFFKKCCANGKQCLTMCMGFGCNAAGVIGARIIHSPRERLIAILTNNFVPCNGRFPTLIAISSIFAGAFATGAAKNAVSTLCVLAVMVIGILLTLLCSMLLSKTVLKGTPSHFALELPPYRKPKIWEVIYRSVFDRTLFVLGRAVMIAAPAGVVIFLAANVEISGVSILTHCAKFLDPFARAIGMDGYILMAFILGIPANEIVIPILLMCYLSTGTLTELSSLAQTGQVLLQNGWTVTTAICVMLFSLLHFPCATTLLTIKKETQSVKWTAVAFLLPTAFGILLCFLVNTLFSLVL